MPIYEYICKDCNEKIEVLHLQEHQDAPKKCGFRCLLPPHDQRGIRGFGDLTRCYSTFSGQIGSKLKDKPSVSEIQKSGFSVYRNEGDGVIKKISGKGPEKIDTKERFKK